MNENQISAQIVDVAYRIHTQLGSGIFESVYLAVLEFELNRLGIRTRSQVPIPVKWQSLEFSVGFRADLVVENKVIVEVKSLPSVNNVHKKQLLTYLRLSGKRLGLLINFGDALIKDGITRIVNGLPD